MGKTFLDSDLEEGEEILHRTKLHWITFRWSAVFVAVAIYIGQDPKGLPFAMALMSVALFFHVVALVTVRYSELKVTDRRLILRVGFAGRNYDSIPLEDIDNLTVENTPVGDKLGYGTFIAEWEGGSWHSVERVKGAAAFLKGVEEVRGSFVPPSEGAASEGASEAEVGAGPSGSSDDGKEEVTES